MYTTQNANRSVAAITLAIVIAFLMMALNLAITFSDSLPWVFGAIAHFRPAGALINFLFLWLMLLLWVALRQWRTVSRMNADLEAVVSSISPDALLVVSQQRTVRMCNEAVERIFGYAPREVINQTTDMLYHDRRTNPQRPREIFEVVSRNGFHYGLATGKRKGGGTVPLEIITGQLVGQNGAVLLVRDITERLALEEQRRRIEQRALQAQKLESLGVLAGGVAHDFNNLLTIINGHADLILAEHAGDAELRDSIGEILKAGGHARDLCKHLMSFAGRAPRDIRQVNLSRVAAAAAKMQAVRIPAGVQVQLEPADDLPPIPGDEAQLHQVAMNLIFNACEAIGAAAGFVRVATGTMACDSKFMSDVIGGSSEAHEAGLHVYLRVTDTGCGMDEATRRRICEPFFTTKKDGHGMGMAAVLGIVRSHGGVIKVESVEGRGSTFTVLFPLAQEHKMVAGVPGSLDNSTKFV